MQLLCLISWRRYTLAFSDHGENFADSISQTNFKDGNGKVYMTHATKAIYGLTMMDTVRLK